VTIEKYGNRFWAVYDADGSLVCVTVYKRGAKEVVRRLTEATAARMIEGEPTGT